MQHRLQNVFRRLVLQVKQQHTDILKTSAGAVITHKLNHAAVPLILTDLLKQPYHTLFRAFEELQDIISF